MEALEFVAVLIEDIVTAIMFCQLDHDPLSVRITANFEQLCTNSAGPPLSKLMGTLGEEHPAMIHLTAAEDVVARELVDQVEELALFGVNLRRICSLLLDQVSEVSESLLEVFVADGNEPVVLIDSQLGRVLHSGHTDHLCTVFGLVLLQVSQVVLEEAHSLDLHDFHNLA